MSEWKPGDVCAITWDINSDGWLVVVRGVDRWHFLDDVLYVEEGGLLADHWLDTMAGVRVRPLLVIDPENTKQVRALGNAWDDLADKHAELTDEPMTLSALRMQHALREFARPTPTIEEPQGLGAVVADAYGETWVSVDSDDARWAQPVANNRLSIQRWADINAVRILSAGVES